MEWSCQVCDMKPDRVWVLFNRQRAEKQRLFSTVIEMEFLLFSPVTHSQLLKQISNKYPTKFQGPDSPKTSQTLSLFRPCLNEQPITSVLLGWMWLLGSFHLHPYVPSDSSPKVAHIVYTTPTPNDLSLSPSPSPSDPQTYFSKAKNKESPLN